MLSEDQKAAGKPTVKVLLADTNWWANSSRVAIGLAQAGCDVVAICPTPSHALTKTRAVRRVFPYKPFSPLDSLLDAIREADPDIVIPSCDRSLSHLHELYSLAQSQEFVGDHVAELIERSLGLPASHSIVSSRYGLLSVAREEGIRVPDTHRISGTQELSKWAAQKSFPWVLKADRTWGGGGVRVVHSMDDAGDCLWQLTQMSRFSRAVKRLFVNKDPFWLRDWWVGSERAIIAQTYIYGRPANCTVVCWEGRILAGVAVKVTRSEGATGPASIVRIVSGGEMLNAAARIARRLGLSGFFGLDFMIEDNTEKTYLIEMNPRLAPPCHLRLGNGRDLVGALWAQLASRPAPALTPATESDLVAYFPQGLKDEANLPPGCFRDIPQDEPELVAELLNPFPDRTFLFRLVQRLNRKPIASREVGNWTTPDQEKSTDHTPQSQEGALQESGSQSSAMDATMDEVRARPT